MRLFLVGFNDWVQVREGLKAPKKITSEIEHKVPVQKQVPAPIGANQYGTYWGYKTVEEIQKRKLKVIHWEGGKVLGSLKHYQLYDDVFIQVRAGECREVPRDLHQRIHKSLKAHSL